MLTKHHQQNLANEITDCRFPRLQASLPLEDVVQLLGQLLGQLVDAELCP